MKCTHLDCEHRTEHPKAPPARNYLACIREVHDARICAQGPLGWSIKMSRWSQRCVEWVNDVAPGSASGRNKMSANKDVEHGRRIDARFILNLTRT